MDPLITVKEPLYLPADDACRHSLITDIRQQPLYGKSSRYNIGTHLFLKLIAASYNNIPGLKKELRNSDGWINYRIGIATKIGTVAQTIIFNNGRVSVNKGIDIDDDVTWVFQDDAAILRMANGVATDIYELMLKNDLIMHGDRAASLFLGLVLTKINGPLNTIKVRLKERREKKELHKTHSFATPSESRQISQVLDERHNYRLKATRTADQGVRYLDDPYLSAWGLDDFPRIKTIHLLQQSATPEISAERPQLLTEWFREHGFETNRHGLPWEPVLRQAGAFRHLMSNKKPVIQENNLLAGSLAPETVAVMLYPDTEASQALWAELETISSRPHNPHAISAENRRILKDILPFWRTRTIRNWILKRYNYPLSLQIDDRTAVFFNMKLATFSHTIPNIPKILTMGTTGVKRKIAERLEQGGDELTQLQRDTLKAMTMTLEGLEVYASNLAGEADHLAAQENEPGRQSELREIARVCRKVPLYPAETLQEAFNAAWIFLCGVLMENNNISLSPGRLDQCFQPYFASDMSKITDDRERQDYVKRAVELAACFFLRISHHQMALPDLANMLYSGTQSDSAITLGGVTPDGTDAVNDMTYIFLKVTEMLGNQEPNVNVRYHPQINSDTFLKRVCEVNYITSGTPSIHNDVAVFASLVQHGFDMRDIRDWGATGCVEPTLSGKHTGHTNALCMNLVAGLEMALNNGYHPLLRWDLGPHTGSIEQGDFKTFDEFFVAYERQMQFLIEQHCILNYMCGEAHAYLRPQPFLSSVTEGCITKALDNTRGGAQYNTSGSFNAGMADVTDSMMAIKKLVFEEKVISFADMKHAIDTDFRYAPELLQKVKHKIPLFGSGSDEAVVLANSLTGMIARAYRRHRNFRGGQYMTGFWSVSWHSGFGKLSNTTPSGRIKGKAFTPGFTPQPHASRNLLDNLRDMAKLDPTSMDNNVAFNVKFVPSGNDSRERTVDIIFSYAKTFCELGGMQLQFNMVDSRTLRDAMVHPENYRHLLVRVSGYNALFVELSRDLQIELIERTEFAC